MATLNGTNQADTLNGGASADLINAYDGNDRIITGDGADTVYGGAGNDEINGYPTAGGAYSYWSSAGSKIVFGEDGNDFIYGSSSPDTLDGGSGNDTLYGGNGNDVLIGGLGDDKLYDQTDGQDTLLGGDGNDYLNTYTGTGNKYLDGGAGADSLYGGSGADYLIGGDGNDLLDGSAGNDTQEGGLGNDTIYGGSGNDSMVGGSGDDKLYDQTDGQDTLLGGDGNDYLSTYTGTGNKYLDGGLGADSLYGGNGADTLIGGAGSDYLDGDTGNDAIDGGTGNDTIYGGAGNDFLEGGEGTNWINTGDGADSVIGGNGDDNINGHLTDKTKPDGAYTYYASAGIKNISSGGGDDFIYGGTDGDSISAGDGNDVVYGASGNDIIDGGTGNDVIYGGLGSDTLEGGTGADHLIGGDGNDVYYVDSQYDFIYDVSGSDTAFVSTSFVKLPSTLENVIYTNGALALPYWIDALLPDEAAGLNFKSLLGGGTLLNFAFPQSIPNYDTSSSHATAYLGFNSDQIARTKEALSYISSILDLQFVQTTDANQSNTLSFANNSQTGSGGYALFPNESPTGSDVFLNKDSEGTFTLKDGQYQTLALIHEIGHALGLEHPFIASDATGAIADPPYLSGSEDSTSWTVMSYTSSPAQYYLKYSPLDIAALQYLYGPSKTARTGNDTYTISNSTTNFIWDGAGLDVIDASAANQGATIYLTPGYWGYVGSSKADKITSAGQITVNFGSVIENLVGSSYNDHLYGNEYGNQIQGGSGNDTLDGGAGIDTASWTHASSNYQLTATSTGWKVTDKTGTDGTDTVTNIEKLQFSDRTVIIESKDHGSYADLPTELYQFFITAFNAAPGVTYMDQLAEAYRYGLSVKQIVDIFTTKKQFTDVYSPSLSHADLATQLVNNIVKNSASTTAKTEAIADIKGALDLGWTVGEVIYTVFGNLAHKPLTDTNWGNTAKQFGNEIVVAKYYSEVLNQSTTDLETLRDAIQPVSQSTDVATDAVVAQLIGVSLMTGGLGPGP